MPVDVRTVYITAAACYFMIAAGLFFFQPREFQRYGIREWIVGQILYGAFWALMGLRGIIPDFISFIFGPVILSASYSVLYAAVREFQQRPYRRDLLFIPVIVTGLFFLFFWGYMDRMLPRAIFLALLSIAQIGAIAFILLSGPAERKTRSQWFTGCIFLFFVALWFFRLLELFIFPYQQIQTMGINPFRLVLLMFGFGLGNLACIGFLLMIREQTAEELRDNEEEYRNFMEDAPIGICIVDVNGHIQYINRRIEDETGWTREELIGRDGFGTAFFNGETRELLERRLAARISGDAPKNLEIPICRRNGNLLWADLKTRIVQKKGVVTGAQLAFTDITERKLAEEALRESETKFRDLAEKSVVGIYLIQEGRFQYVNQKFAEMWGYRADDLMNYTGPIDAIVPVDKNASERMPRIWDTADRESFHDEFCICMKNQELRHAEVYGSRTVYRGKPAVIGTLLDVTVRKRMEKERQELQERLYHSEKMEALGVLAGGVAHDLNNVLGVLTGYSELLLLKTDKDSPAIRYITNIMKSSERAAAIVNDLLTLARRGVHASEIVDLNDMVLECQKTPEFEKLRSFHPLVRVKTILQECLPNIKGSPVHLGKMVMNLISNAAEAMDQGGPVTVTTSRRYLETPVEGYEHVSQGDYVVLSVADTGHGISESDMKRIFEPFYTKKVMGRSGTGLGLTVVWGTVKDHNGYIDVQSEEGKGTTFTLYFPATEELIAARKAPVPTAELLGRKEAILVVDDVREQRDIAAQMLSELNYEVATAAGGEEALTYLKEHHADLIVLDMIMDPGMDGLDTYQRILETCGPQKAVIVSGFAETDRVKKVQALGAGAYIRKPYAMEKLGIEVRKELDRPIG